MNKYKTLIYFLILTALWSILYAAIKYFLWWNLSNDIDINLQTIAGFLSFWSIVSYLIGWAIAYTFLKKYVLFVLSILAILVLTVAYWFHFNDTTTLGLFFIVIGFLYGLWSVIKNVLISIEIKKTWLQDTTVNALIWIIFIVFIIFGSILWWILAENLWNNGFIFLILIAIISSIISLFLNYDTITLTSLLNKWFKSYYAERKHKFTDSMRAYIPDIRHIAKRYYFVMISSALLWSISTIVSQKAIEYSVMYFDKVPSSAAILLLYSALWVILWSIISMKMEKKRWFYFVIFNICFAFVVIAFPFLSASFKSVSVLAFIVWFFFGWAVNLIDAFFFRKIGEENKKEYGSSTFWLLTSFVIFIMMFLSSFIDKYFWLEILMLFLWVIIMSVWVLNFKWNT